MALRALGRWLVTTLVVVVGLSLLAALWAAIRIAGFEQREADDALESKAAELAWMAAAGGEAGAVAGAPRPNVVVILFDDLGYGDIGAFGSRALETPRLDALAREGLALDHFYSPSPICSPARAGYLTGRWPVRTTLDHVVFPSHSGFDRVQRLAGGPVRLPADEITLAEALRAGGYATGFVGKWHLGDHSPSLPQDLGFEHWFGVLHSNDMEPLPLWRDGEIVAPHPVDQTTLTARYTRAAIEMIENRGERPFFLYLAHTFPHIPLHASAGQAGNSHGGLYGDVVADLDRSTGELLDALDRLGLAEETLVIVTSDNGPWFQGSRGTLRGRKGGTFEGGMRVPFLARWPGQVPEGTRSDAVAAGVDLFPTLLGLAGVPLPRDRVIDGVDLEALLRGDGVPPERPIFFRRGRTLEAVRVGGFKWRARGGIAYDAVRLGPFASLFTRGPWLFDLGLDPDESYDVHEKHPETFARLSALAAAHEDELAANPRGWLRP